MAIMERIKKDIKGRVKRNLNRNYITRVLNILAARPILSTYGHTFASESDRFLNIISIKNLKKAYSEDSTTAYGSLFLPYELFHGLGLTPFLPEVMSGFTAGLEITEYTLKKASSGWYTPDLCTFHRSASGAVEMDLFPKPDFVIVANLACDAAQKTFYIDAARFKREDRFYLIDVPYEKNEKNILYLKKQLKKISMDICKKLDKKIDINLLKEAIRLSNDFRNWALKLNNIRKELILYPKNFNGLNFILPFYGLAGTKDAVTLYKNMYFEFKKLLDKQRSLSKNNNKAKDKNTNKKLLWLHLKPYYKNNIFTTLENNNYRVVFEEINNVYWPRLDPEKPFESMAIKLLSNPLNGKIENRINAIKKMAKDYNVDGVILFAHWGCRHSNGGARIIKDSLNQQNIPTLVLDGDCLNKNNSSTGQILTRLQGFMEIIDGKY